MTKEDLIMKNIAKELPKNYALQRIVMAALDVLMDQLKEHEQVIVDRYGTELLELLSTYEKEV